MSSDKQLLREVLDAGETLATYTQGFSENRTVAEAKETLERGRAALTQPDCTRCGGDGFFQPDPQRHPHVREECPDCTPVSEGEAKSVNNDPNSSPLLKLQALRTALEAEVERLSKAHDNAYAAMHRARDIEGSELNQAVYAAVGARCAVIAQRLAALLSEQQGGRDA